MQGTFAELKLRGRRLVHQMARLRSPRPEAVASETVSRPCGWFSVIADSPLLPPGSWHEEDDFRIRFSETLLVFLEARVAGVTKILSHSVKFTFARLRSNTVNEVTETVYWKQHSIRPFGMSVNPFDCLPICPVATWPSGRGGVEFREQWDSIWFLNVFLLPLRLIRHHRRLSNG